MLTILGVAGLLGIIGTLAAVLWTAVLGVGGAPGAALARLGTRYDRGALISVGIFVSFLIESYLLLAFCRPGHPLRRGLPEHPPGRRGGRVLGVCSVAAGAGPGVGMAAGDSALA